MEQPPGLPPLVEYSGRLYKVFPVQQVSEKFSKRTFVLEVSPRHSKHPEFIPFELKQERCALVEPFRKGDPLTVYFVVRGRRVLNGPGGDERFFLSSEVVDLRPDLFAGR